METYTMMIRDKFISKILDQTKKREYRLGDAIRSSVKIGDILVLTSKTDDSHYVRAKVIGITHYKNWEEVLKAHWQEDFSALYATMDDALKECLNFYTKEEIDLYGILAFDIRPLTPPSLKGALVLLDTNVVIQHESYVLSSDETDRLYYWFDKLKARKVLHPTTKDEIIKNTEEAMKNEMLNKLEAYYYLTPSNSSSDFFRRTMGDYLINSSTTIDNGLLFEVYLNKVDFLVTNDKEMLSKAKSLFIKDRVFSAEEFVELAEKEFPTFINYPVLKIRYESFQNCDLNSPFFVSLRQDYNFTNKKEFDNWFRKKAKDNECAYVYRDGGEIKGFLYLKWENPGDESYDDISPTFSPKRRLKIGTFKNEIQGMRVGERFLKIIFDNAKKQEIDEIYVTLFQKKREEVDMLCSRLKEWGFVEWGQKKATGETVLVKSMKAYDSTKSIRFNFPLTSPKANYFFLPIEPDYHTDLFPDYVLTNENISLYSTEARAHRYALGKVYVSGKKMETITAKPGDIVVIYRIGDRCPKKYTSVVTGTAVIEEIVSPDSLEDYLKVCKNVTIFSTEELTKRYVDNKSRTVIKLIQLDTFDKKVTANFLQDNGIVEINKGPRPLQPMTPEQFGLIIRQAKVTSKKGD
jgi:ASC-1-like (ASCH) protein/predicted nucleic acid-binding protein